MKRRLFFRKVPRRQKSRTLWRSGRVILKGHDMTDLRWTVYRRAQGRCEIEKHGTRCNKIAPWDGWQHGELSHELHRAHGGSDTQENCKWACFDCHRKRHPGPQFSQARRERENGMVPPVADSQARDDAHHE